MATLSRKRGAQELEDDWKYFIQIQMTDEIVHIAKELTKKLSLRGSDSVHFASALLLQRHFANAV